MKLAYSSNAYLQFPIEETIEIGRASCWETV